MADERASPGANHAPPTEAVRVSPDKPGQEGQDSTAAEAFIAQLADEDRMLIILKGELYEGSWQAMLNDLRNRLEGKPYIFKLANRIRDDIARIDKLRTFEEQHQVDLADYVKPPSPPG